jgi:hypothetical protein
MQEFPGAAAGEGEIGKAAGCDYRQRLGTPDWEDVACLEGGKEE